MTAKNPRTIKTVNKTTSVSGGSFVFFTNTYLHPEILRFLQKYGFNIANLSDLNSNPDITFCEPTKDKYQIAYIREKLSKFNYKPLNHSFKIFFISQSELLGVDSQNTLLKPLEEPSESSIFVLVCKDASALLPTILSRCIKFECQDIKSNFVLKELPTESELKKIIDKILKSEDKKSQAVELVDQLIQSLLTNVGVNSNKISFLIEVLNMINHNVNLRLIMENVIIELYN